MMSPNEECCENPERGREESRRRRGLREKERKRGAVYIVLHES